jgi:tRNA U34 5-methylaminomethyl-2-thiouridine-forming methyltransferase MnmC
MPPTDQTACAAPESGPESSPESCPDSVQGPAGLDPAGLDWRDGRVPVSRRFGDPYFSLADGLAETRHVFLAGNALPGRFRPGFRIAELGFGTGLNLCAALIAWRAAGVPGRLCYTGFEADPLPAAAIARALAAFPAAAAVAEGWLGQWDAAQRDAPGRDAGAAVLRLPDLEATVIRGDARTTLPAWTGAADAWFLDGFAPARNPDLWGPDLLAAVARRTAPGGTFATYTAAGHVRRALQAAGFAVERCAGFGAKRHMTRGVLGAA